MVKAVTDYTAPWVSNDEFSGVVLIAKDGVPILKEAYGLANRSFDAPNRLDTKFNLGSMNKMFTSTAVMQLVENGVVSLHDTLTKYLDESWLPREFTDRITIHHLLTHTSGLGSYFNETYWNSSRELYRALMEKGKERYFIKNLDRIKNYTEEIRWLLEKREKAIRVS